MSTRRLLWIAWALALAAIVFGLAWQVAYANGRIDCVYSEMLILCEGPLDPWVLPIGAGIGIALIGIGAWALLVTRR